MSTLVVVISICLAYLLLGFVVSKMFKKAGVKWYLAYIPVVNFVFLLKLADLRWPYIFEYIITLFIPLFIFFGKFFPILIFVTFQEFLHQVLMMDHFHQNSFS